MANLTEASLARFWQHLMDKNVCLGIVSAERGSRKHVSASENKRLNQEYTLALRKFVNIHGYSFNKAKGGYVEKNDKTGESQEVTEESTIIYAKCENKQDEKAFKAFIFALGVKYDQESVFWVGLDKKAQWLYTRKYNYDNMPLGSSKDCGVFHPKLIGQYFTKVGKKNYSFVSIDDKVHEDLSWFKWTPSERRGFDTMRKQLHALTEQGKDYYESYFKNASRAVDDFISVYEEKCIRKNKKLEAPKMKAKRIRIVKENYEDDVICQYCGVQGDRRQMFVVWPSHEWMTIFCKEYGIDPNRDDTNLYFCDVNEFADWCKESGWDIECFEGWY